MTARFAKILIAGVAGSAAMTGVGLLFKLPFGPELPFSGFAFTALWVAFVWLLQTARRSAVEAGSLLDARMLTADAQKSLEVARAEAARLHHDFIGTEHALLGLFEPAEGVVAKVLRNSGLDRRIVREEIEKIVGVGLVHETTPRLPYTPRLKQAVELAAREASAMGHDRVGPEYLLLGLLVEGQGVAGHVLKNLGVSIAAARAAILREAGGAGGNR